MTIKRILTTILTVTLALLVALFSFGCSSTPVGDTLSADWGITDTEETYTYDVLIGGSNCGSLTLKVRKVYVTATENLPAYDFEAKAESVKAVTVKEQSSVITGEIAFTEGTDYFGDTLSFVSVLDRNLKPVYSYKYVSVDSYNLKNTSTDGETPAVSYCYTIDYTNQNGAYSYIDLASQEVKSGELVSSSNYYYDNDSLIFILRSLPLTSNASFTFEYETFTPKDGVITKLYSTASADQSLTDIPYYGADTVNSILVYVRLNQSMSGLPIKIYYGNDDIVVKDANYPNGTSAGKDIYVAKPPLKIIESTTTYVLRGATVVARP